MHNREAIEMMQRCHEEITRLQGENSHLRPRAEAFDAIQQILGMVPRQSVGMGESLPWVLKKRIEELQFEEEKKNTKKET